MRDLERTSGYHFASRPHLVKEKVAVPDLRFLKVSRVRESAFKLISNILSITIKITLEPFQET